MIRIKNDPIVELLAVINALYPNANIDIFYDSNMNIEENEFVFLSEKEDIIYLNPNVNLLNIFELILYNVAFIIVGGDDPEDTRIDNEASKIRTMYKSMTHHPSNNLLH